MVKFSQELWDGFEAINTKSEQGIQVVKDVTEFLKKRAELELEYSKKLAALCKTVPGAGGGLFGKSGQAAVEKETKTLKAAVLSIQEEGSRAAAVHQEFANKINNDVVKPLDTFLKTKEADRKKVTTEGLKRVKSVHEAKVAVEKTKEAYHKASKEAEVANEAHEKAKSDLHTSPTDKKIVEAEKRAAQKVGPLNEKVKAAEAAYHKAVESANDVISKTFSDHLPPLIDTLQQLEEERYKHLNEALKEFLAGQRAVPTNLEERCQEIEKQTSSIDIDADLSDFVDSHRSSSTEPEKYKFIAYKEQTTTSTTTTTTTSHHVETKETEKEREIVKKEESQEEIDISGPIDSKPTKTEDDLF